MPKSLRCYASSRPVIFSAPPGSARLIGMIGYKLRSIQTCPPERAIAQVEGWILGVG